MSDYIPNPPDPRLDPRNRDPRNYDAYYEPSGGRGLTLVVGILVAIALVAGLMFFHHRPARSDRPGAVAGHGSSGHRTGRPDPPADGPAAATPPAAAPAAPQ